MAKNTKDTQLNTQAKPLFTEVRVHIIDKDSLKALVSCKVADTIFLTGLRVVEGKNGLFVAMPNRKTGSGEYQDIYFPASKASRDELQSLVLAAYNAEAGVVSTVAEAA